MVTKQGMTSKTDNMPPTEPDSQALRAGLVGLFQHIQKIRQEIAMIRRPGKTDKDHFSVMSDELDAIVGHTEEATETIMENVEAIDALVTEALPKVQNDEVRALLDQVPDKSAAVFEACAFQDITGQRITKVVSSMKFIETRVNALIEMWGSDEITRAAGKAKPAKAPADRDADLLNGPQLKGEGVSQSDVDAMFDAPPAKPAEKKKDDGGENISQADIDNLFD